MTTKSGTGSTARSRRRPAREAILEAAVRLFERDGFQAASIDAIADAAGVSRRTVYHHFETKNEILVAATLEQAHLFLEELRTTVPPSDDFPGFVIDSLCFVIERSPGSRFFMLQMAKGGAHESASVYFQDPRLAGEWLAHFREPYIRALRLGRINPAIELPELLAWFGRIATSFLQHPEAPGRDRNLRATLDLFFGSALRSPSRREPGALLG